LSLGETSLEITGEHAAAQSRREHDSASRTIIDTFLTEGKVGDKTLDLFVDQPELSSSDRQLVSGWQRSFIGLFAVLKFCLMDLS